MKRAAHLLGFWLWLGFSGGAIVLLFVATPIESYLKGKGMPQVRIDMILSGIALSWVAASFLAARAATRRLPTPRGRWAAHVAGATACAVVFTIFLQAGAGGFGFARAEESSEGRFTFGPYPDEIAIARLKQEGYTGIISLLNPLIPFEAVLLEKERQAVAAAGLSMIEAPMLPWVSSNRESLDKLVQMAFAGAKDGSANSKRYYVHCYLGHHRVELARITLMDAQGIRVQPVDAGLPEEFELGPLTLIGDSIVVGPLPTQEEYFLLRRAGVRHIVSLLNPRTESIWLKADQEAARDLNMELHILPANDPSEGAATAKTIRALHGKVYIHAYLIDERARFVMEKLNR